MGRAIVQRIRGNYDEAVAGTRTQTGIDYAHDAEEKVDMAALAWTRAHLSPENMEILRSLPGDARMAVTRGGRQATPLRGVRRPRSNSGGMRFSACLSEAPWQAWVRCPRAFCRDGSSSSTAAREM